MYVWRKAAREGISRAPGFRGGRMGQGDDSVHELCSNLGEEQGVWEGLSVVFWFGSMTAEGQLEQVLMPSY